MLYQFNEGVRQVLAALTVGALTTLSVNQLNNLILKNSNDNEEIKQALEILDREEIAPKEEKKIDILLTHYKKQPPVIVKPKVKREVASKPSSTDLIRFIIRYEGFHPNRYWDHKQWSIGFGSEAGPGEKTITKEEALRRLQNDISRRREMVRSFGEKIGYNWSESQIDALTSFHYNIGSLRGLTANGKRSNQEIAKMILKYNKASGVVKPGLVARRKAEHSLFTQSDTTLAKND